MIDKPEQNLDDPAPVPAEQLTEFNARFLRAVERARAIQAAKAERRHRSWRPLLGAAACVVVLGLVFAVLLLKPRPGQLVAPATAESFGGVAAVVISSFDRHVVPGVEVWEQRVDETGRTRETLAAITNSQGVFSIAVDDRGAERRYVLRHGGVKIGEFVAGSGEHAVRGFKRISVDVPPEQLVQTYEVSLEPGGEQDLSPGLGLALGRDAAGPFSGTVVHDQRWPTEFNYGDVLGGVYAVEGDTPPGVKLRARISRDQVRLRGIDAGELRLIAHSDSYLQTERSHEDQIQSYMGRARAMCHRGWYVAGEPPLADLPRAELAVVHGDDGAVWLEWSPEGGRRYAIVAPPSGSWEAGVLYSLMTSQPEDELPRPNIGLVSQSAFQAVSWIYDVEQFVTGNDQPFYLPIWPQANYPRIYAMTPEPRGYGDLYEWHTDMLADAEGGVIPAEYYLRRYDLTTVDPQLQGPFTVDTGFKPGHFDIRSEEPELGQLIQLELTGDLDQIDGAPTWDFDWDAVIDARGLSAEYLPTVPGIHEINVVFRHVSGNFVQLTHRLNVLIDGVLSFEASGRASAAVVAGKEQLPVEEQSFWVISEKVIAGRPSNSLNVTNAAGPTMYIQPPQDWIGRRLREVRAVLYVSPRGGDYKEMFISYGVDPVRAVDGPVRDFELINSLEGLVAGEEVELGGGSFQTVGSCWLIESALLAENDVDSPATARERWMNYLKSSTIDFWVRTNLGFDYASPPPNDELVTILREFRKSDYYTVKYATEEQQELRYAAPLFGAKVTPELAFLISTNLEHQNMLLASQYEVYSGGRFPARVELETTDGEVFVRYFDYSVLDY